MTATPSQGFGLAPFGVSSYGYGTPALAEPRSTSFLLTPDGEQGSARLIVDGDYVLDPSTGHYLGMTAVEQKVYLALLTIRGSSIVKDLGQSFSDLKIIGDNIQVQVEDQVNQALSALINDGEIELVGVTVDASGKRLTISVQWMDLSTESVRTTAI